MLRSKRQPNAAPSVPTLDAFALLVKKAGLAPADIAAASAWLAEQLVAAEFAKLGQGGHTEARVPLQRVFVDLPVSDRPGQTDPGSAVLFLDRLLEMGARSLGLAQTGDSPDPPLGSEPCDDYPPGVQGKPGQLESVGFLLIGGPGQGKSTLGQLACQLHRAALLLPKRGDLSHSARNVLDQFAPRSSAVARHELALPKAPLLPLAISLPDLSAWLAKLEEERSGTHEQPPAMLRFIADQASARQTNLDAGALLSMIRAWPTLIFLDGFDEVGSQDDRHRIVTVVQEMLSDLHARNASVQILATTRPQGYAGELSRIGAPLASRYLLPLGRDTAMLYAERLVEAKIQGADGRQKVLERLRQAANEPAMARLMTSPLQVTILAALVQHGGSAPRERWTLFKSYFDFTYRREIERDSYASPLLSRQRGHIEQVHLRVALLLQVESEESGGASAQMKRERLEEITDTVLQEDEVAESERRDLVRQILDAAERRLVFLVEPEPGRFGFEIRSLQEFMAAWALTEGGESELEARLLQIAPASMFRNVLLFVASRLYSEAHHLRDRFATYLCPALEEKTNDSLLRASRAGALLALETLEEGAVLTQPKRARALMIRATGLLDLPPAAEHTRLARVTNDDTRDVLSEALQERIFNADTNGFPDPLAVWVCLTECCNRGKIWATTLWDDLWPKTREPGRILEAVIRSATAVKPWFAERLEADAARVLPRSVVFGSGRTGSQEVLPGWFGVLWDRVIRWRHQGSFAPLATEPGIGERPLPSHPPPYAWRSWCAAAVFESAPTAKNLAEAISKIRESSLPDEWSEMAWRMSWPLAACLRWAQSVEDLQQIERSLHDGSLGDLQDWVNAERMWSHTASREIVRNLLRVTSDDSPWLLSNLSACPPLAAIRPMGLQIRSASFGLMTRAASCFRSSDRVSTRARWAEFCLMLLPQAPANYNVTHVDVSAWISASERSASWLIPKPRSLPEGDWLSLLREYPEGSTYARSTGAIQAAIAHPDVPALVRAALEEIVLWHHKNVQIRHIVALADKLRGVEFQRATARLDAILVRLLAGESERGLMESLVQAVPDMDPWSMLLAQQVFEPPSGIQINVRPDPLLEAMMAHHAAGGWRHSNSETLIRNVRRVIQSRRSNLVNPDVWRRLGLPEPLPLFPGSRHSLTILPDSPIVLQALEVKDLRGLSELSLSLASPIQGQGQWTVLLGPNGVGKTTLLRALVLSLRNLRDPAIWPKGVFSAPWIRVGANDAARITVRLDDVDRTVYIRPGRERLEQSPELIRPRLFPLFAYGCRRGSALGGMGRAVDTNDDGGPEVATLFDDAAGLVHAETWLIQWEGDALKNPTSLIIYDAIRNALCRLLDVSEIEVKDRRLWVIERDRPPLPLGAMSDGYLTTAGWFIDLVARWIELASRHGVSIEGGFLERMTGLVILDEIDLHLHPSWQIDVIRRTRALVPRMSFVVTTHNPLTLVGARPEEIWILSQRDGRVVAGQNQDAPMLLTGGQIFSRYFGIESSFPAEMGSKLHRYGFLSGYAARSDDEQAEMEQLRGELRDAGIEPGWEDVPRNAAQDVDQAVFLAKATPRNRGPAR